MIVADLRGHRDSSVGWNQYDVAALASDIEYVLDAEKIEKALLIGCSISGASTAYFAAQHPERVAGLVGLSPIRRVPFTGLKAMVMPLILRAIDCRSKIIHESCSRQNLVPRNDPQHSTLYPLIDSRLSSQMQPDIFKSLIISYSSGYSPSRRIFSVNQGSIAEALTDYRVTVVPVRHRLTEPIGSESLYAAIASPCTAVESAYRLDDGEVGSKSTGDRSFLLTRYQGINCCPCPPVVSQYARKDWASGLSGLFLTLSH